MAVRGFVWSQKCVKRRKISRTKSAVQSRTIGTTFLRRACDLHPPPNSPLPCKSSRTHDLHPPPNSPLPCKSAQAGVQIARLWVHGCIGDVAQQQGEAYDVRLSVRPNTALPYMTDHTRAQQVHEWQPCCIYWVTANAVLSHQRLWWGRAVMEWAGRRARAGVGAGKGGSRMWVTGW